MRGANGSGRQAPSGAVEVRNSGKRVPWLYQLVYATCGPTKEIIRNQEGNQKRNNNIQMVLENSGQKDIWEGGKSTIQDLIQLINKSTRARAKARPLKLGE